MENSVIFKNEYEKYCSFATTGQFEHLSGGFTAHCGPVAVTNAVLTYWKRHGLPDMDPNEVFLWIARFGKKHLLYVNGSYFNLIGGTSDALSGTYLTAALRHFGIYDVRVSPSVPLVPRLLKDSLIDGTVAYVQLRHHPKYGNHHLVVYASDGTDFIAADGWKSSPVRIQAKELGFGSFRTVKGL